MNVKRNQELNAHHSFSEVKKNKRCFFKWYDRLGKKLEVSLVQFFELNTEFSLMIYKSLIIISDESSGMIVLTSDMRWRIMARAMMRHGWRGVAQRHDGAPRMA